MNSTTREHVLQGFCRNSELYVETEKTTLQLSRFLVPPHANLKTRDIHYGFWELRKSGVRRHVRWSTVLYCEPAHMHEEVEMGKTTSQTLYFDLPINKRRQLYRAYQELVRYRPWKNSPDETFLSAAVYQPLKESDLELEHNNYSLMRFEAFPTCLQRLAAGGGSGTGTTSIPTPCI